MKEQKTGEIIDKISEKTGKSGEEIQALIDIKIKKFSGLLTEQGAAFMVQKELGVKQENSEQIKIVELTDGMKGIELKGNIKTIFPVKEFEKNGKKGKLLSFILGDDTGETRVTLWNDQIDKYDLTNGSEITIENAFASTYNDKKQITLGFNGIINVLNKKVEEFSKLSDLKPGMGTVNIYGRLLRKFPCKEFETGERKGKLCNFQFGDETALLRATAWNDKADEIAHYNEGDVIEIKNAYTKKGLFGIELHLGYSANLKASEESMPSTIEILKESVSEKNINQLIENENTIISGKIADILNGKLHYTMCEKCGKKVSINERGIICEKCGEVKGKPNAIITITLEDETGKINANLFGKEALKIINFTQEELEKSIEEKSPEKIIEEIKEKIVSKEAKLFGYEKNNSYSGENEFNVKEVIK